LLSHELLQELLIFSSASQITSINVTVPEKVFCTLRRGIATTQRRQRRKYGLDKAVQTGCYPSDPHIGNLATKNVSTFKNHTPIQQRRVSQTK
jgi:hypothetical protein